MKQHKGKQLLQTLHRNKPLWAVFSLLFSLLLVVGSTYSWYTYSDERINQVTANDDELVVEIEEAFTPNLAWSPGTTTKKELAVTNKGKVPAIVRLSLYEFFLAFEVALTDGVAQPNGELATVSVSSGTDVALRDISTWVIGNTYPAASGTYYVADDVYLSTKGTPSTAHDYLGTPAHSALAYLNLDFNSSAIYTTLPGGGVTDYWYYENGYFYYSEVLQPGDTTAKLLHSVTLSSSLPNKYKGALYQLVPMMDAHDISKSLLTDWSLTGTNMDTLYTGKLH